MIAISASPRKLAIPKVMDQGYHTEVAPVTLADKWACVNDWIATLNDGEEPTEEGEEECTEDVLACLKYRLESEALPFVNFGIWRPFGQREGGALKFTIQQTKPDGTTQPREINGPSCFEDWSKGWAVFEFAMGVLKAATKTRLGM